MKNKKGISLIILILIVTVIIIIASVIMFFTLKNKDKEQDINNSTVLLSSKKDETGKIAFTIGEGEDLKYVLTLSLDEKIELPEDYLIDNNDDNKNFNFEIEDDEEFSISFDDINIEIYNAEPEFDDVIVLKQKENWYLVKDDNERTCIILKTNIKSDNSEWIAFNVKDSSGNDANRDNFDKLTNIICVYKARLDNEKIVANDLNNNVIDLENYKFIKDEVAKSLLKYGIKIKKPIDIWSIEDNEVWYLDYSISIIPAKEYTKNIEMHKEMEKRGTTKLQFRDRYYDEIYGSKYFSFDNQTYELLYCYIKGYSYGPFGATVYRKISDDLYLEIEISNEEILKDESAYVETAIQRLKEELL